jgi:hypothetical protein
MTESAFQAALAAQIAQSPLPDGSAARWANWPADDGADLCAQCAHTLQHTGAPASAWQPWLMLACWGWALAGLHWRARALAVALGVADELAPLWPEPGLPPRQPGALALSRLLGLLPLPHTREVFPIGIDLSADKAWEALPGAIQARDWPQVALVLATLAEDSREAGGAGPDWNAETAPGYELLPTGAAAMALRAGFPPDLLSATDWGAFWPAFAGVSEVRPLGWPSA